MTTTEKDSEARTAVEGTEAARVVDQKAVLTTVERLKEQKYATTWAATRKKQDAKLTMGTLIPVGDWAQENSGVMEVPNENAIDAPCLLRAERVPSAREPGAFRVEGIGGGNNSNRSADEPSGDEEDPPQDAPVIDEAILVEGEDAHVEPKHMVYDGKSIQSPEQPRQPKRGVAWGIIAILAVAVFLAVILVFSLASDPNENSTAEAAGIPANAPKQIDYKIPYSTDIPGAVRDAIEQGDVDSPYYKANKWVLDDPHSQDYSMARLHQRFYMVMVWFATNGATDWIRSDDWLDYNVSECDWYTKSSLPETDRYYPNRTCDENSTLVSLSLSSNNLTGSLPQYYAAFIPGLQYYDIGDNHIHGLFPMITSLPDLVAAFGSGNHWVGPPQFAFGGFFKSLKVFKFDRTGLRGDNNAATMSIMPAVEIYNVTGQHFDADLYPQLSRLSMSLEWMGWGHTNATGTIPTEWGQLSKLRYFDLSDLPRVTGPIPSELGLLTQLTHLDLMGTPVTGVVPEELCVRINAGDLDMPVNCSLIQCCNA